MSVVGIPQTVWTEDDDGDANTPIVPQTAWAPNSGEGDYTYNSALNIVDPTDSTIEIADPAGVLLVSPTVEFQS